MTTNLLISLQCGGSFHEVHAAEERVCTVLLPNKLHGTAQSVLVVELVVVQEHIDLAGRIVWGYVVCTDTKAAVQQPVICFFVELFKHRLSRFFSC